ncbi:hypothetical protein Tco_0959944, partial [Tanacetum coccineum]
TVDKAEEMVLHDTLQVSLAEHKRREEQKARENMELVNKHLIPGTRLEPKSDKESPEVESTNDEEVEVTNVVIPVNVNEEEDEITYEALTVTGTQTTSSSRSPNTKLSKTNRLLSLFKAKPARFKQYKNLFQELQGRCTYLFGHLKERFLSRKSFDTLADHLQEVMVESLPTMVDTHIKEQVKKQVPEHVKDQVPVYVAEGLIMERQKTKEEMKQMIAKTILQERRNIHAEISAQIQKAIDHHIPSQVDALVRSYMSVAATRIAKAWHFKMKFKNLMYHKQHVDLQLPFASQDNRDDPHYDANPEGENMQSGKKTSEFKAYSVWRVIVWTINEEERGPSKIQVSLTIDEQKIKENADEMLRQRLWVNKSVKKFNPYARYGVKHWKNPHAKIFYIKRQKESGKPKEERLSVQEGATDALYQLPEPDYKNLNKNDNEELLLIKMAKVPDYGRNRVAIVIIIFHQKFRVEKHKMFSIIYEPMHGIIYKNNKKEKRVVRHSEIHKFCDATLNRVLEGLKSYNNDVKYGYVQRELTADEVEYLKLFEEEIEIRLKYHNQMRRWEMYVNGRPLGSRRERPE